ncbi:MAG TPA: pitrilysin family protein, partial [Polyangiaceae bacterium]|nr:pitrilysin family protein [Polyangiaceae bacterium]
MRARGFGGLLAIAAACASQPRPQSTTALETPGQTSTPVDPLDVPTPMDAAVKKGTLPNGLTYYVRRHGRPEQRASLWLAVDAGAVLEDDDQRGIAHFVEHMAFNGTTRFPKHGIVDFIERAGMTMGADVNATTGLDQTVYRFTVPTDHEPTVQQGLDVLRDIAGGVSFDPSELELERPVILEEWRLRRGANLRLAEKRQPVLFQGSRYAERNLIGTPEIIRSVPVQTLRRFYEDWYRPDQMALIAVGDFEPATMEREIRQRFSDLRAPQKPRARKLFAVPRTHAPAVTVMSDPELRSSYVNVLDKVEPMPKRSRRDFRNHLVESLYLELLSGRLSDIRDDPREPFVSTTVERLQLSRTLDAIAYSAGAKEGRIE